MEKNEERWEGYSVEYQKKEKKFKWKKGKRGIFKLR